MKYNYSKFLQYTFFNIFILSFIIFIFLNYFGSNYPYFDHDTAFFSYMGRQLLNGYSFNEIVFDNKHEHSEETIVDTTEALRIVKTELNKIKEDLYNG